MSGHSKWSTIRHKKAATDAKRANAFTKISKLVTVAAREGGGDIETNFKLKMAIEKARSVNMPKDNIERAIKAGTGELKDGAEIEEITYEAYGPGNIAMIIETATDNRNRTVSELKHILDKSGGKMVPSGSVGYLFKKVGGIEITVSKDNLDDMELKAIEAGAEDTKLTEDILTVYTRPEELQKVKENLEKENIVINNAELEYLPTQAINPDEKNKSDHNKLLEKLDDHDDVQEVYSNLI